MEFTYFVFFNVGVLFMILGAILIGCTHRARIIFFFGTMVFFALNIAFFLQFDNCLFAALVLVLNLGCLGLVYKQLGFLNDYQLYLICFISLLFFFALCLVLGVKLYGYHSIYNTSLLAFAFSGFLFVGKLNYTKTLSTLKQSPLEYKEVLSLIVKHMTSLTVYLSAALIVTSLCVGVLYAFATISVQNLIPYVLILLCLIYTIGISFIFCFKQLYKLVTTGVKAYIKRPHGLLRLYLFFKKNPIARYDVLPLSLSILTAYKLNFPFMFLTFALSFRFHGGLEVLVVFFIGLCMTFALSLPKVRAYMFKTYGNNVLRLLGWNMWRKFCLECGKAGLTVGAAVGLGSIGIQIGNEWASERQTKSDIKLTDIVNEGLERQGDVDPKGKLAGKYEPQAYKAPAEVNIIDKSVKTADSISKIIRGKNK